MTPSGAKASHRLKAEGFPRAPLIEAIIDVLFERPLEEAEIEAAKTALERFYPSFSGQAQHRLHFDLAADSVEVATAQTNYRGVGADQSELVMLRREGIGSSQLAPYRDWEALYSRFARDLATVSEVTGHGSFARMAVRSINRIDVSPDSGVVRYEDYITVHPQLPGKLDPIHDFSLELLLPVPEIKAIAKIITGGFPQAVEGRASFVVDIDVFRTEEVPSDAGELAELFSRFRKVKNDLYRTCLTKRALEEFEE